MLGAQSSQSSAMRAASLSQLASSGRKGASAAAPSQTKPFEVTVIWS